ncbi:MAG: glycine cleavage system aminomethyltransferase GcvT, partial [Bacillota bacterium]|nr:glycine cleavage system aminomethyltransferase GcvT [Bacillota bacterium]
MGGLRTPLWSWHREAGARMVDFAGWEMPVQYQGILEEHGAVRREAGLFDISHMGEIRIQGKGARDFLQYLLTHDVGKLVPGRILYSPMCREDGGTLDDLLLFQLGEDDYLAVVNAANEEADDRWMKEKARDFPGVRVENESRRYGALALQGPLAQAILEGLWWKEAGALRPFRLQDGVTLAGVEGCLISRTGYTGEDGFEVYAPWEG